MQAENVEARRAVQVIEIEEVQSRIDALKGQDVYVHVEMTNGMYAQHNGLVNHLAANFIQNALINYSHGMIKGDGPFRVGLKTELGWVYTQGLTHYERENPEQLILSGHDSEGKLIVTLLIGREPF
jgi:hypothetical protein